MLEVLKKVPRNSQWDEELERDETEDASISELQKELFSEVVVQEQTNGMLVSRVGEKSSPKIKVQEKLRVRDKRSLSILRKKLFKE